MLQLALYALRDLHHPVAVQSSSQAAFIASSFTHHDFRHELSALHLSALHTTLHDRTLNMSSTTPAFHQALKPLSFSQQLVVLSWLVGACLQVQQGA